MLIRMVLVLMSDHLSASASLLRMPV